MSKKEKFMRSNRRINSIVFALAFILFSAIYCCFAATPITQYQKYVDVDTTINKTYIMKQLSKQDSVFRDSLHRADSMMKVKKNLKMELINEAKKWMNKKSPKHNVNIPPYLVEQGLDKNIDICFMMSQTQLETNYGTLGIGRPQSKHSLFGVYQKYSDYQSCINYYTDLLLRNYLVKGKTEKDLMKNYVNKSGHRYAESKEYERHLTSVYKEIVTMTNIQKLQIQYNELN